MLDRRSPSLREQPERVRQGAAEGRVVAGRFERGGDAAGGVELGGEDDAGQGAGLGRVDLDADPAATRRRGVPGGRRPRRPARGRVVRVAPPSWANGSRASASVTISTATGPDGPSKVASSGRRRGSRLALRASSRAGRRARRPARGPARRGGRPVGARASIRTESIRARVSWWQGGSKNCATSSRQRVRPNQAVSRL